jgi:cis-3-alkyl-4-acyloxetan-2-one decarboxylase
MDRLPAPPVPAWLAPLIPFERSAVGLSDGQVMHVMETGQAGELPVLMLHGNPSWGFLWRKVASQLSGAPLRLIMPDLIGLGFSSRPRRTADHTLERHGAWIGELIDRLELKRVVLVLQDWGGPIGLEAISRFPERLAGLVILNTVLGPPRPGFKPTAFHRFAATPVLSQLAFRVFGYPQRNLGMAQGDRSSISGDVSRAYRYPLRGLSRNAAPLRLARLVPDSLHHPSVPALEKVNAVARAFTGPSAIVWGDRDPVLGRAFKRVHETLPDAHVTRTQGGHFLQEEVPAEIAAAIRHVAARAV